MPPKKKGSVVAKEEPAQDNKAAKDEKKEKPKMEYRFLGKSGLRVSAISYGAWVTWGLSIDDDEAFACMKAAYDAGCNFFDNAEGYGSGKAEVTMGKCLKRLDVDRSELIISTKIFWGGPGVNQRGLSRKHIIEGTNACLRRLQLEYVDLLFCHRPDPHVPIEETVRAMNYLIDQGKTFYWGTSEWSADQIMEAHHVAKKLGLVGPTMEQPQYSMLHRTRMEQEYARMFKEIGLGTTIWSPLASGLLTGKYSGKQFPSDSRLGGSADYKWLKDQLLSGEGMNGL
jgi:voltage-dependent potassium channel beta subunit